MVYPIHVHFYFNLPPGCCLGNSRCFLVVVLVTLCFLVVVLVTHHVCWLLSWLLCFLVVVLVTHHVCWLLSWLLFSGCCLDYSLSFLVVVMVTLHVFWLLCRLLSMFAGFCLSYSPCLRAIEQHTFHISVENSNSVSGCERWCIERLYKTVHANLVFPILLLTSSPLPPLSVTTLSRLVNLSDYIISIDF